MTTCSLCGNAIHFVVMDGRAIPLHQSGRCGGAGANAGDQRRVSSADSCCRRTNCPVCRDEVYFVRHNGGSVYLDPPLGAPWSRHPCMEPEQKPTSGSLRSTAVLASPSVLAALANVPGLVTGVVTDADVGPKRQYTVLTIAVAEPTALQLFVRGGADSLVGKLVIINAEDHLIHAIDDAGHPFKIVTATAIPKAYLDVLARLRDQAAADRLKREFPAPPPEGTMEAPLAKYRKQGFGGEWKLKERLRLIALLQGREKQQAIHAVAIIAMERGSQYGDVTAAALLTEAVSVAVRQKLLDWFRRHSPIVVSLRDRKWVAHVSKNADGTRKPYLLTEAKLKPFFVDNAASGATNAKNRR